MYYLQCVAAHELFGPFETPDSAHKYAAGRLTSYRIIHSDNARGLHDEGSFRYVAPDCVAKNNRMVIELTCNAAREYSVTVWCQWDTLGSRPLHIPVDGPQNGMKLLAEMLELNPGMLRR